MKGLAKYTWEVTLQNPEKGLSKTFLPVAISHTGAISGAFKLLRGTGYDDGDFIVTDLNRKGVHSYVCA